MSNLSVINQEQESTGALVAIEQSRAVQEVQASLVIAKKFPRDTEKALQKILENCKRPSFAAIALYTYKRGGTVVSDGSIRLAEMMAQNYGNLDFGVREIEQRDGVSICQSFCFDKETNTKQEKNFHVAHQYKANGQMKVLTDNRDIYEYVANQGARRLRACIFGIVPFDFKEAAVAQIRKTLAADVAKKPIIDSIRELTALFKNHFQVTVEMLNNYLGHPVNDCSADEIVELQGVLNSLRDKQAKREDFFDFGTQTEAAPATSLRDKLKTQQEQNSMAAQTGTVTGSNAAQTKTAVDKVPEPEPQPKVKTPLQERAGALVAGGAWPEYKDVQLKDIPQEELLTKLAAIETMSHQGKLSEDVYNLYGAACTYLERTRNLKA